MGVKSELYETSVVKNQIQIPRSYAMILVQEVWMGPRYLNLKQAPPPSSR